MPSVEVRLGNRSYSVRIGAGVLAELGPAVAAVGKVSSDVVIADETVARLYAQPATASLRAAALPTTVLTFPAGESSKTLATVSGLIDRLFAVEPPIDRSTVIVALGGGVTGDIAGFVAAIALRGLRFFQCPTTLLADVDSSVGGKTGVDHRAGKNLIGAFHQPSGVLVDVKLLNTLPMAELANGLAECVKHAIIAGGGLLEFIERNAAALLACDAELMTELVARNVAVKAEVVSADERESGRRAFLNLGHTIGHALETLAGYSGLSHGAAVALGMVCAMRIAERRGMVKPDLPARIEAVLARLSLPVRLGGIDAERVLDLMRRDKKSIGGKVRMVLPLGLGKVDVFDNVEAADIIDSLKHLGERPV